MNNKEQIDRIRELLAKKGNKCDLLFRFKDLSENDIAVFSFSSNIKVKDITEDILTFSLKEDA